MLVKLQHDRFIHNGDLNLLHRFLLTTGFLFLGRKGFGSAGLPAGATATIGIQWALTERDLLLLLHLL